MRWIVVEKSVSQTKVAACYGRYSDAVKFCQQQVANERWYSIMVLGDLLKTFRRKFELNKGREAIHLNTILVRYPIEFVDASLCWKERLLYGCFCPLLWRTLIHPLSHIERFVILGQSRAADGRYDVLSSSTEFADSIKTLHGLTSSADTRYVTYFQYGHFFGYERKEQSGYFQEGEGVIGLHRVIWEDDKGWEMIQLHNPTDHVIRRQLVFARYHPDVDRLAFYDEHLSRIRPIGEGGGLDVSYFGIELESIY